MTFLFKMTLANESRKIILGIYIEYPKNGPVCGASSAQRKKPTILNVKHDLPYIEELRNIQPVDDPTVEPTTKWDVSTIKNPIRKKLRYSGFNGCPSKISTYVVQDFDQFSIGRITKTLMIAKIIRCMEFAHTFRSSQRNKR